MGIGKTKRVIPGTATASSPMWTWKRFHVPCLLIPGKTACLLLHKIANRYKLEGIKDGLQAGKGKANVTFDCNKGWKWIPIGNLIGTCKQKINHII